MSQQRKTENSYTNQKQPISLHDLPSNQQSLNQWTGDNSFSQMDSGGSNQPQPYYMTYNQQSGQKQSTPHLNQSFNQHRSPLNELNAHRNSQNNLIHQDDNLNTQFVAFQLPTVMCNREKGYASHEKHNTPLTMVCVNKYCLDNNSFLLCSICSESEHFTHEQVPLKLLIQDIISCMNDKTESPNKLNSKLANLRAESLDRVKEIRQKVNQRLDDIEQEILYLYETLQEHQVKQVIQFSQKDILESIDNLMICRTKEQFQAEIRNIMNNTHIEGDGIDILNDAINENTMQDISIKHDNLTQLLLKLQKSCEELLQNKEKQVANFTVNCNESFSVHPTLNNSAISVLNNHSALQENIIQHKNTIYDPEYPVKRIQGSGDSFNNLDTSNNKQPLNSSQIHNQSQLQASFMSQASISNILTQRFEFSKTLRDPNIILQRRIITNGNYSNNNEKFHYRVQMVLPELETTTPSIKQWSFKITRQLPHWIGFGMCHINEIKKAQFKLSNNEFSFSNQEGVKKLNDHNSYLITTHGWAFGHKKQPAKTPFRFSKNDIITCRFDPFKNYIIFFKNNDFSTPYNLAFESICWNKLYPCVVFWYPEDSVELL